ncbi:MAG: FAD binding domain-containing protein [Chloroflexota bacterium]|jgi:carbon-monoxide dehydrogenase medium subunit|nr:xanthine dehydrogenase family protein subunit M [Chloroflexota bacterium]
MIPAAFDYLAPASLDEAIDLLARHGPDAKILSGGMSLIPAMKIRLAEPAVIVDINGIPDLEYLREEGGQLHIGAMTRESAFEQSGLVRHGYPILFETAKVIADPLVRNRATIGGNIAHADPANDHPATMLAVGATIVARGPNGTREIAADDFFTGFFSTALEDGEMVTEIRVPAPTARTGSTYLKFERKVGDYAIAAVAVNLEVDEAGHCTSARIGLTNVSDVPMRARNAESALIGHAVNAKSIEAASREAAAECDPKADLRGPVEYKRDLVRVLAGRAIGRAVARAQGRTH